MAYDRADMRSQPAVIAGFLFLLAVRAAWAAPTVAMNGHLPSEADCASMQALGATAVRMDFNWFQFEPAQDAFTWGHLDGAVASARAHGLKIYATVAYTPPWAATLPTCTISSPDENQRCENKLPANVADWVDAVTKVVTRFKGQIECWGPWNEPNLGGFFQGTEDDFVDKIFLPAAAAIRAADPGAKICGPELAGLAASSSWNGKNGTCAFGGCIRNGWEIDLAHMLDRLGAQIDVVTQHTYQSDAAGVMSALLDGSTSFGILQHDAIRNVVDAHGGAGKEFWLTETGWEHPPQGSMPEADVAARIADLYAKQEEVCAGTYAGSLKDPWRNWTRTYYFHFPYDPGSGWGIVAQDGSPLPPYTALQGWANGRATTACTGPGAVPVDAGTPGRDAAAPGPDAAGAGLDAARADATAVAGPDAGARPDAASAGPDAGGLVLADGGAAGVDAAAAPVDAGPGLVESGGCGCDASAGWAAWPLALALAGMGIGRRRRS